MKQEKLVFFGSGPVAAKSLALLAKNFEIEAVITKPATLAQMKQIVPTAKSLAAQSRAELDALIATSKFTSRLAVLVDFGIIVSQSVIDYFPLGIINSHFSLLPEWRGADPISFAILSGQKQTGVSLMLLVEAMDEGPLLAQTSYEITSKMTTPELTDALIEISDAALKLVIPRYASGEIVAAPQTEVSTTAASYSRKLTKADGLIDWTKPAAVIEREIRAFIDWPKSRAWLGDVEVIVTKAHNVPSQASSKSGELEIIKAAGVLMVATSNGSLCIESLKPAGKKEMTASEFLRGYTSQIGEKAKLISS